MALPSPTHRPPALFSTSTSSDAEDSDVARYKSRQAHSLLLEYSLANPDTRLLLRPSRLTGGQVERRSRGFSSRLHLSWPEAIRPVHLASPGYFIYVQVLCICFYGQDAPEYRAHRVSRPLDPCAVNDGRWFLVFVFLPWRRDIRPDCVVCQDVQHGCH